MSHTSTGGFPIGFRIGWSPWQKDVAAVCRFALENHFDFLDIAAESLEDVKQVASSGLEIGTVDLPRPWEALASADAAKRTAAVERAAAHVKASCAFGVKTFFAVVFPDDPLRKRSESLALAADGFRRLCDSTADCGARFAIEGYPGSPPHFSALACTPESYRALFEAAGTKSIGVNYDPSHLIRMGIDPVRFLEEFSDRIFHVHAKDTELLPEGLYQFGNLQSATLAAPHGFGGHHWRYTIPGKGNAPWPDLLRILKERGYNGGISVELEDENFNGTETGEKRGTQESLAFLAKA